MALSISPTGTVGTGNRDAHVGFNPITSTASAGTHVGQGDVNADIGVSAGPGGVRVGPQITIGQGHGSNIGGQVGGGVGAAAGAYFGGPLGAAAGQAVGSLVGSSVGSFFNPSKVHGEHVARDSARNKLKDSGFVDSNYQLALPDGTSANLNLDGHEGTAQWRNPSRRVDKEGERPLNAYETDYTNDLDFLSGMAGTTLSRILLGGKNKPTDQMGQLIGNQILGSVGRGADFTQENFDKFVKNTRAAFSKGQIQTKEDLYALSNQMFAQGRINDADHAAMLQVGNVVFDGDFNKANQLMAGRWNGIKTASATPSEGVDRPGRTYQKINSPFISPEEAQLSVQPLLDSFRRANAHVESPGMTTANTIASGLGLVSAITGLYRGADKVSGGGLTDLIKNTFGSGSSASEAPSIFSGLSDSGSNFSLGSADPGSDISLGTDFNFDSVAAPDTAGLGDFTFDSTLDF